MRHLVWQEVPQMYKTILAATDGSDHAGKAVDLASDLAEKYDAKLVLIHVLLSGDRAEQLKRWAEVERIGRARPRGLATALAEVPLAKAPHGGDDDPFLSAQVTQAIGDHLLQSSKRIAAERGVKDVKGVVTDGDPAKAILACAKTEGADLIVIGSRGLGDLKGLLVGSVSHKVSQLADCTCITVR
jgi:nucleotide-binding universal stress UspA family protein